MNDKQTLLFEVILDIPKVKENAETAVTAISRLRQEKAATEKEFKSGAISGEEYGKSILAIDSAIAKTSTDLKGYQKTLSDNEKAQKSATGSITQLRVQLIQLQSAYDKLSEGDRNSDFGKGLLGNIDQMNEKLLDLEKSTGRAQRNVGNYTNALDENKTSALDFIKNIRVAGVSVGETSEKLRFGGEGAISFGRAILTSRGALIALSAVPIVLFLTAIVAFLTRSKDGMEFLQRKTAAFTAVLDYFGQKFVGLGKAIIEAFEHPGDALVKLGELITENLTNRVKAFSVILDGLTHADLSKLRDGFIQLFTGIEGAGAKVEQLTQEALAAAAAGEAVARESQRIADAERALTVERAKSRAEVEKLKLVGDDVSKSNAQRLAATQQAFTIEQSLLNRQIDLQKQRIANIKAENKLHGETKEGLDTLAEAETRIGELTEESTTRQIELNNKLNQIRIEGQQQFLQKQLAQLGENLRITQERGFQTLEIEKQILAKQLELDLVGVVKGSEQEKALRLKYKSDLANLILADTVKQNERANQIDNDNLQARLAAIEKGTQKEFDLQKEAIRQREFQEEASARLLIKDAQELEAKLLAIHAQATKDRAEVDKQAKLAALDALDKQNNITLAKTKAGTKAELDARLAQIKIAADKEVVEAEKNEDKIKEIKARAERASSDMQEQFAQQRAQMIEDSLNDVIGGLDKLVQAQIARDNKLLTDRQDAELKAAGLSADIRTKIEEKYAQKKEELDRKSAEKQRKIATAQNLIATARAVTEAQILPPPFDIIKTVLAIATGAAQQAVIASQTFAKGGIIEGPSHAAGGVKYRIGQRIVELEGGEGVINKRSMANPEIRQKASELNQLGGGIAYPGTSRLVIATPDWMRNLSYAKPYSRLEMGGIIQGIATYGPNGSSSAVAPIDYNKLARAMASLPAPIVQVSTIRSEIGKQVKVESRADITG